jgi:hypothetical protein
MRSIRIAVYISICISFARKILAKVQVPPGKHRDISRVMSEKVRLDLIRGLSNRFGIPESRIVLCCPTADSGNSFEVAIKGKKLGDEIVRRMWQSIPPAGDPNAFKAYTDLSI